MVNAAAQYRRALKKELRCPGEAKKRLMAGFDQSLSAYLEESNDPTTEDLYAAFGPPESMAYTLMQEVTPQEQAQYHKKSLFKKILAIILAVVLMLFSVYVIFIKEFSLSFDTTITIEPTISTTEEVPK